MVVSQADPLSWKLGKDPMSPKDNKMHMATYDRSLHCGDLHSNIPWYNILVVPSSSHRIMS